ncbi:MAG: hypothetical protein JKX72_06220 [Robiginitomaculum sp.]|nr:hypothetical protein [Robiginitomaculum sp.]
MTNNMKPKPTEWLTPLEFTCILEDAFGGRGWKKKFCEATGLTPSTIHRYMTAEISPIPQYICLIVRLIQGYRIHGLELPAEFFRFAKLAPVHLPDGNIIETTHSESARTTK